MRTTGTIAAILVLLAWTAPVAAAPLDADAAGAGSGLSGDPLPEETPALEPATSTADRARTTQTRPSGDELRGLLRIREGVCDDAGVTAGSYFRMVQPHGDPDGGPFVSNADSPCGDDTYTPLSPGADGGLLTGTYQAHPDPAFSGGGHGLAGRITAPQSFFGTRFATATNATDPQTGTDVDPPLVVHDGAGGLDGDLRAFAAGWNRQHFNQGAPKPDGSRPGNTAGPTGTYDPDTGEFTLSWSSHIQGGPFDGFTGVWHLEGVFEADGADAGVASTDDDAASGDQADPGTTGGATAGAEGGGQQLPETGGGAALAGLALVAAAGALTRLRGRDRAAGPRPTR